MTYEYEETSIEVVNQYKPVRKGGGLYHTGWLCDRAINRETGNFFARSNLGGVDDRPSGAEYYLAFWEGRWLEIELNTESSAWDSKENSWKRYTKFYRIRGVNWEDGFSIPNYTPLDEAVTNRIVFFESLKEVLVLFTRNMFPGSNGADSIILDNLN